MVTSKFEITNPLKVNFTMTITMSLEEWTSVRDELSDKYPAWQLSSAITSMIIEANQKFVPAKPETSNA